ncbi:hypothetical protein [Seonamhaeicola sp.]|uniref:hypothetical protein n=1 Tax=Seonamhaeicola sp. TaxID=1912245 RepID=UPI0035661F56
MKKNRIHNIKESGFKTPEGYFNSLENNIMSELKLKELATKSGFNTPNNYFDTLENNILDKVTEEKAPKVIQLFSRKNIIYASSIAAAILLLFNLSIFENKPSFDNLDNETVENYILNENIETYEIASLLSDDELTEENFVEFDFEEETVENYILDNIELEDLY